MLTNQVIVINGERFTRWSPSAGEDSGGRTRHRSEPRHGAARLIDAHTHMFNDPVQGWSPERMTLMAVTNMQADLYGGITSARDMGSHSNGYADVDIRNAINDGELDGPRFMVSGRGIVWGAQPAGAGPAPNPRAAIVVRSRRRDAPPSASTSRRASITSSSIPAGRTPSAPTARTST
jgi:hypothetical protein